MTSIPRVVAANAGKRKHGGMGRFGLWAVAAIATSAVVILVFTAAAIARQGAVDEARSADAIVVFGAAEYAGRPSPVYRARLDHGFDLFEQGRAPLVITTGGAGADPRFNEGGVGRDYLARRGVPDSSLIAETQGSDTAESAQRVAAILHVNGMHSIVAVSDAYHIFRIKRLMARQGISAYGSPRSGSVPRTTSARISAALREAVSYLFWRVYPASFPQ